MEQIYRIGIGHGNGTMKVIFVVDGLIVKKVLKDGTAKIGEKYLKAIGECATEYLEKPDESEYTCSLLLNQSGHPRNRGSEL